MLAMLMAFVAVLASAAQEGSAPSKVFVSDQRIHDFGTIKEKDGKVSHVFTFTNKGRSPIVINDVSAWCGCTTTEYTKAPVGPGKTAKVKVTYNPYRRPGRFSKEVVVITEGGRSYTRVWVKGNVVAMQRPVTDDYPYSFGHGLYMNYQTLAFPPLKQGETFDFTLRIANATGKQMTVVFDRKPNNRVLKMPRKLVLKPNQRTEVSVSYRAPRTYKYNRRIVVMPIVNGSKCKDLKVTWAKSEN